MGPPYLPSQPLKGLVTAGKTPQPAPLVVDKKRVRQLVASESKDAFSVLPTGVQPVKYGLQELLVYLRALSQLYISHHWQTYGATFYGDHKLYEQLYNESLPFVDQVAERLMGTSFSKSWSPVNPLAQAQSIAVVMEGYYPPEVPDYPDSELTVKITLIATLRFLTVLNVVYESLASQGKLKSSPGTDNLLQGLADKFESFAYLLSQRNTLDHLW